MNERRFHLPVKVGGNCTIEPPLMRRKGDLKLNTTFTVPESGMLLCVMVADDSGNITSNLYPIKGSRGDVLHIIVEKVNV